MKRMSNLRNSLLSIALVLCLSSSSLAQGATDSSEKYVFKELVRLPTTIVKSQAETGTCWCFATTSFLESELLRMGEGDFDLSEMFTVHNVYSDKAERYVRFHGTANFGQGGQAHDVINSLRKYGMMPDTAYPGLCNGQTYYNHSEMEKVLTGMVKVFGESQSGKLSPEWEKTIEGVTEVYLGAVPGTFSYNNKSFTPKTFAETIGLNPDDYVEITSYTHHPFYDKFPLEVPDNWSGNLYYNLPIDELIEVMNNALKKGYTVVWDGDVSDRGFSHKNGVAIIPDIKLENGDLTDRGTWEKIPEKERSQLFYSFTKPVPEKKVTQEMRQLSFNNFSSTDDHLMHITGIESDQNGKNYYRTKNSWGPESNKSGGYVNISEAYVRLNTLAIMVNKDAIPKNIQKKLGIK